MVSKWLPLRVMEYYPTGSFFKKHSKDDSKLKYKTENIYSDDGREILSPTNYKLQTQQLAILNKQGCI